MARNAVPPPSRREEIVAFIVLAIIIWPILAVGVVGGYGFIIWMFQLIYGPPGPPHH
ncbi:periplasmic nitrate reductase, NapE protein [Starkeya sp. ORNL1]|uniref:periplasmic nitrate reductase, NapE protein n=1 Tax=Starkeya sp. ORNL1 TaxID=2709380 RepID=UPI001FF0100C|nr:periplasmic nitrate reductase, NapE protein [Starkeya sp. ORNL1]